MSKKFLKHMKEEYVKKNQKNMIKNIKEIVSKNKIQNNVRKYREPKIKKRLYITEGESAANAILNVVDPKTDGVLFITGKINNIHKMKNGILSILDSDGTIKNENILNLMSVLKINIENIEYTRCPYNEIIIAADADDDGTHIVVLLISLICTLMPEYKRNKKLKVLFTPNYIETDNKGKIKKLLYTDIDIPICNAINCKHMESINYEHIKGLGQIEHEYWEYFKQIFGGIHNMALPVDISDEDFNNTFISVLDPQSNIRKQLILKSVKYSVI